MPETDALEALSSLKMRAFVEHYVRTCNLNGTRAAIAAGYSENDARHRASMLLRRTDVKTAVQQLLEEKIMSAEEVEARLGDMARANLEDFLGDDGEFDYAKAKRSGLFHLIKEIKFDKDGGVQVKLHDAKSALDTLAKRHGMLRDHVDITSSGQQLQALTSEREKLADLTPEQLEALYRASLDTS